METYYFGRLNFTSQYELYDLLTQGNAYRPKDETNIKYGVFDAVIIDDESLGLIISGELVKYQDLKEEPVVKEDRLSSEYISDAILGKSRFYLLEKSHLLAYNPYGRVISNTAFCKALAGVMLGADDGMSASAEIFPINYEYEFSTFLKSMRTISSIDINLKPSNPNNYHLWEGVDNRLRDMNLKRYSEKMVAKDNESIAVDELTEQKIAMAQDGYGKAKSKGTDADGNQVEISTETRESITKLEIRSGLGTFEQLNSLRRVFDRILGRFKK